MITAEDIRLFCLNLPHVTEGFPFDEKTLVFKVGGKMFLLMDIEDFNGVNVKCDPELAVELRERFSFVEPGYHMNKKHWNTISISFDLSLDFLKEQIVNSYKLIFSSLTKKQQAELT